MVQSPSSQERRGVAGIGHQRHLLLLPLTAEPRDVSTSTALEAAPTAPVPPAPARARGNAAHVVVTVAALVAVVATTPPVSAETAAAPISAARLLLVALPLASLQLLLHEH
jgi:hypothetical protein